MMSKQSNLTTPPESFINPPLTPPLTEIKPSSPRVSKIIEHLQLRKAGCNLIEQPWTAFQLLPDEFKQLIAFSKLDEALWSFLENQVRYDYFSSNERFVLRMPTSTHEFFRSSIVLKIQEQLEAIAAGTGEAAEFARSVRYRGSPRLRFPVDEITEDAAERSYETSSTKYDAHEPDAAFGHLDAQWPGVVIEVSFSQKKKDLKDLAEDYILGSDGNICAVIGLDIEYKQSKKATLSVWRPQYVCNEEGQEELISTQTVVDEEFRNDLGNPNEILAAGLDLRLKDFGTEALVKNEIEMTQAVSIPSSILCNLVARAESDAETIRERKGKMVELKPGARKRRRQRTPPEELKSDDERRFLEEEEKDAKRTARRDDDCK